MKEFRLLVVGDAVSSKVKTQFLKDIFYFSRKTKESRMGLCLILIPGEPLNRIIEKVSKDYKIKIGLWPKDENLENVPVQEPNYTYCLVYDTELYQSNWLHLEPNSITRRVITVSNPVLVNIQTKIEDGQALRKLENPYADKFIPDNFVYVAPTMPRHSPPVVWRNIRPSGKRFGN